MIDIDEKQLTEWIKENTLLDDGLTSQQMSIFSIKSLLLKYHHSELNKLSLGSVGTREDQLLFEAARDLCDIKDEFKFREVGKYEEALNKLEGCVASFEDKNDIL
tara:strand:- start:1394 stop:1708 length:315 start_codon:yes stop_codon:yes gene_type:complete